MCPPSHKTDRSGFARDRQQFPNSRVSWSLGYVQRSGFHRPLIFSLVEVNLNSGFPPPRFGWLCAPFRFSEWERNDESNETLCSSQGKAVVRGATMGVIGGKMLTT